MKFRFTRKTWYFMLILSAALSLADALALLFGESLGLLAQLAFAAAGMAILFLAAQKEPGPDGLPGKTANPFSGKYMIAFFLLLASYVLFGAKMAARMTLCWPVLAWVESKRGMKVDGPLKLLIFSEVIQMGLTLAQSQTGIGWAAGILWVLVCVTRGWLGITLYKASKE